MSSFTADLDIRVIDARWYKVLRELSYYFDVPGGDHITVCENETVDCNSVPRLLWPAAGHPVQYPRSGAFHDIMYRDQFYWRCVSPGHWIATPITRRRADRLYHQMLLLEGASRYTATIRWLGVRVGGWRRWRRARRDLAARARLEAGAIAEKLATLAS